MFNLSSANAFDLVLSKILSFDKELIVSLEMSSIWTKVLFCRIKRVNSKEKAGLKNRRT